ncbi:protein of unknown function [Pararobbsia alpina]|uniref:hypothetical protein n=1 Tax=Pararobbsia alpina TaxID=621374 RepID=UPI0039A6875C
MKLEDNGWRHLPWRPAQTVIVRSDLSFEAETECAREANRILAEAMQSAAIKSELDRQMLSAAMRHAQSKEATYVDMSRSAIVPLQRPEKEL